MTSLRSKREEQKALLYLSLMSVALLAVGYAILVAPGTRFVTIWLNDEMALTDAAYRTFVGQIPSIDFQSGLGALAYYPITLAFQLGLNQAVALGFGQLVVAAAMLTSAILVCHSRFKFVPAAIFVTFLFLLIVVPMRLGGTANEISYGIFYNRHGWAGLAIVLLTYVEPKKIRPVILWRDSVAVAVVLLYLIYSTLNFASVAFAFIVANALISAYNRRVAVLCLSLVAAVVAAVELSTGYNSAYIADILYFSGSSRLLVEDFDVLFLVLVISPVALGLALLSYFYLLLSGRRRLLDFAFLIGAIAVCIVLTVQSAIIAPGFPALIAVLICFGELARREQGRTELIATRAPPQRTLRSAPSWILGLTVLFVAVPVYKNSLAMFHVLQASRNIAPAPSSSPAIANILVDPDIVTPVERWRAADYLPKIIEGVELLENAGERGDPIVVFDSHDPFSPALSLPPTRYGFPLFWVGAAFSREAHPDPEQFFSNARYAMVPESSSDGTVQTQLMLDAYGPYLEANFEEIASSTNWALWARRAE